VSGYPLATQRLLLDLQAVDSRRAALDQQYGTHPALAALADLEARDTELASLAATGEAAAAEARAAIKQAEREAEQIRAHQQRDQKRLDAGAVSSPRELEGLQHEIATLQAKVEVIEEAELESMERLEQAEAQLADVTRARAELTTQKEAHLATLEQARATIDAERATLAADREALLEQVPDDLVARYERSRAGHGGVGVGAMRHGRCEGCRLNLTPVDLARVRSAPDDALLTCEECGRLLVRVEDA
jgi:predicted  nucleic acid-binding Zn-ribbon protein